LKRSAFLVALLTLLSIGSGLAGAVWAQRTITTTSTRVVTVPATTITTTIQQEGGTATVTISIPAYVLIVYYSSPDQLCTVTINGRQPPSKFVIPGTTIQGTTFSTVIDMPTVTSTFVTTEGGTTFTTTGWTFATEVIPPLLLYGEILEHCSIITVTQILTIIPEEVPATIVVSFPGFTFQGTTMEAPPGAVVTTVTFTKTKSGATFSTSESFPGTRMTTVQTVPSTSYVTTIVSPGTTSTEIVTITVTLEETGQTAATSKQGEKTPSTPTQPTFTATSPTTTPAATTTTRGRAGLSDVLTIVAFVSVAVIVGVTIFAFVWGGGRARYEPSRYQ